MGLISNLLSKAAKEAKNLLEEYGVINSSDAQISPTTGNPVAHIPPQEPPQPAIPECPHGECGIYYYHLYHSCEKSTPCPKMLKREYYNDMHTVSDNRIFDFIMRYVRAEESQHFTEKEHILDEYVSTLLPNLSEISECLTEGVLISEGMDPDESLFLTFLFEMNNKCVATENFSPNINQLYDYYQKTRIAIGAEDKDRKERVDRLLVYPSVLLRDPSLFERDTEDFKYSYARIDAFCSPDFLAKFFKDVSLVTVDLLFDKNGNLKPAGIGGAEIGETGDTIWNTLESLCQRSNKNYIGEEE